MNRHKKTLHVLLVVLLCLGVIIVLTYQKTHLLQTSVHMLDVGQGDSFLIQASNGTQVLIDAGSDAAVLTELSSVLPLGDRSIDVVIATHPDADHIGGLPLLLKRYTIGMILTTEAVSESDLYKELMGDISAADIPTYYARRGMVLTLDRTFPTIFTILFPDQNTSGWETNTASVVGRLDVGEASMLFMGDAPESIERYIATETKSVDVDVLKLGHHGSKTSSALSFLSVASPKLALISAGKNNFYGHPSTEVVERLKLQNIPWVSTIESGTVKLYSTGKTWEW